MAWRSWERAKCDGSRLSATVWKLTVPKTLPLFGVGGKKIRLRRFQGKKGKQVKFYVQLPARLLREPFS